jgi:hypothetical protein
VTLRRVVERRARAVVGAVGVLIALLYASIAQAAPIRVRIDAQLAGDLSYIEGVIRVDGADGVALVDPLADLPMPESDLVSQRTFPGLPERGVVRFEEIAPGTWWFYTLLPRRYGDLGSIPRFGLFANGGWYPQPLVGGAPPIADWGVVVRGPEGVTIVIGDEVGDGTARWRGYGERASLAAIPGGRVTDLREDGVALRLVTRGRPSPAVVDGLRAGIAESRGGAPLRGVIVEAPLRRRLVRPGNQTVYLSDRAFRVTPGLARFHRVAVAKGVLEGTLPHPDPWVRSWIAAIFADRYERGLAASGRQRLRGLAWLPTVDALLNDGTMPFYAEVLGDALPGDPLQDDLMERYAPHAAATSAVRQLYAAVGVEAADRWADAALRGAPPLIAAELAGIDPGLVIALRAPVAGQDVYVRAPHPGPSSSTSTATAPPGSPTTAPTRRSCRYHRARSGSASTRTACSSSTRPATTRRRGRSCRPPRRGSTRSTSRGPTCPAPPRSGCAPQGPRATSRRGRCTPTSRRWSARQPGIPTVSARCAIICTGCGACRCGSDRPRSTPATRRRRARWRSAAAPVGAGTPA